LNHSQTRRRDSVTTSPEFEKMLQNAIYILTYVKSRIAMIKTADAKDLESTSRCAIEHCVAYSLHTLGTIGALTGFMTYTSIQSVRSNWDRWPYRIFFNCIAHFCIAHFCVTLIWYASKHLGLDQAETLGYGSDFCRSSTELTRSL